MSLACGLTLPTIFALAAAFAVCSAGAAELELEPGNWKLKVTSTVNGKPEPEQNTEECLRAEELKDLAAYFAPDMEGVKAKCSRASKPSSDPKQLIYRTRCTGSGFNSEINATVKIENARHFSMDIRMNTRTREESALVLAKAEGRWSGACKPEAKK